MASKSASPKRVTTAEAVMPPGLREVLEANRLNLLALFRALDRLGLAQKIPPELHTLFELDADLAEALWALDQPSRRFDMGAMTRDTLASLLAIPEAIQTFLQQMSVPAQGQLLSYVKDSSHHHTLRPDRGDCRIDWHAKFGGDFDRR